MLIPLPGPSVLEFKKRPVLPHQPLRLVISSIVGVCHPLGDHEHASATHSRRSSGGRLDTLLQMADYDEAIRAPRVAHQSVAVSTDVGGAVLSLSLPVETQLLTLSQHGKLSQLLITLDDDKPQTSHYTPATFDLLQPTRRYSNPLTPVSEDFMVLRSINEAAAASSTSSAAAAASSHAALDGAARSALLRTHSMNDPRERVRIDLRYLNQVYDLKTVGYIPAVLRAPVAVGCAADRETESVDQQSPTPPVSPPRVAAIMAPEQPFEPTHIHWLLDNARTKCRRCHTQFTPLGRQVLKLVMTSGKHHCRKCGDVFCSTCCLLWVRLDMNANYVAQGAKVGGWSRACLGCYDKWELFITTRRDGAGTEPDEASRRVSVVPNDWSWSSF